MKFSIENGQVVSGRVEGSLEAGLGFLSALPACVVGLLNRGDPRLVAFMLVCLSRSGQVPRAQSSTLEYNAHYFALVHSILYAVHHSR